MVRDRAAGPGALDDEGEAPAAPLSSVGVHLAGLALAGVLATALWLRLGGGSDAPVTLPPAGEGPAQTSTIRSLPPQPLLTPFEATLPPREPLAGLIGARERFGDAFAIRHPAYLPADLAPFTVNWQPDADPQRRAAGHGELLSWFFSAEHGAVLVLAQGRGVGVWPLTATDGRAGRIRLADGTEAVWFVGHPVRVTATSGGEPAWEGTEITLGVAPSDGDGWYLRSPIVSLPELIRIADSLFPIPSSPSPPYP